VGLLCTRVESGATAQKKEGEKGGHTEEGTIRGKSRGGHVPPGLSFVHYKNQRTQLDLPRRRKVKDRKNEVIEIAARGQQEKKGQERVS